MTTLVGILLFGLLIYGFITNFDDGNGYDKFKNHPAFQDVPEWTWGARIALTLFWPLGIIVFIYTFLKSYFK